MGMSKITNNKAAVIAAVIPILVILFPITYSIVNPDSTPSELSSQPFLERPDAKYKNCVRDTEFMRFHHWELLRTIREEVVRHGVRGEVGLDMCKDCHTSRERFCNQCHDAVSMTPDCYGCHYYP